MEPPRTRYARNGDVNIAYQILGDGPTDLVCVPPFVSNLELQWDDRHQARYFTRLASFSRLIMFDKRGTGLSDRTGISTLEERMDDVRAVMDAAGSERAVVFGSSEGGAMSLLFAATHPQRVSALCLYGAYPRLSAAPDYPEGSPRLSAEQAEQTLEAFGAHWGEGALAIPAMAPTRAADPSFVASTARWERLSASPGAAVALMRMIMELDVRHLLPAIRVPTLVIYRTADALHAAGSRYLGAHIPGAKVVELPGGDYFPYLGDQDAILDEIEEFVTGARPAPEPDRVLATVLFTDIVGSTQLAAEMGDGRWRELLERHADVVAKEAHRYRGRLVKMTGDGALVTFDGPGRAVRCALDIRARLLDLGIDIRAGLHTGEIEILGEDVGGIAVHIGQRVSALAATGEILASSTVVDLVAGSGLKFEERGDRALKGVPRPWRLYAVVV